MRATTIPSLPPPPGMRPTPTSTRPMYVSAAACTRAAGKHTSPRRRGFVHGGGHHRPDKYFIRMFTSWNCLTMRSIKSQFSSSASISMSIRLAPDAEVGPFVGDDQSPPVFLYLIEGGIHHFDDVHADSVVGGMELQQRHVVADVDEAGAVVGMDDAVLFLRRANGNALRIHRQRHAAAIQRRKISAVSSCS